MREHVAPEWDRARASRAAQRAAARGRRRVVRRTIGSAIAIAAMIAIGFVARPTATTPATGTPDPEVSTIATPSVLRLADGSIVTPLDADSEVFVGRMTPGEIELVLVRGAARFEVTPGLPRVFRVRAGTVAVSVIGTVFTVRREGSGAAVEVDQGRVRVEWEPGARIELGAGERGAFPTAAAAELEPSPTIVPAAVARQTVAPRSVAEETVAPETIAPETVVPETIARQTIASDSIARETIDRVRDRRDAPARAAEPAAVAPPEVVEPATPEPDARPAWRAHAEQGRYDEGYALLLLDPTVLRGDDVDTLIVAADCARLSGHPAEALAYLRRALDVGRDDARAPVVAFTLGRVLLQQLGRPADAADAFEQTRSLAPEGTLAQDALAREVEACHRAGLHDRARARALDYLRLYPEDLRTDAVRRLGGLE
ncbi:VgrG protein [Sandaracinus amylolyticus]|uniref:VgrG protein n=1 Tax=Sandaracinus amylolyticus TaxID=927083 RepID=A0A0F6SHB5_9BACT|nr:VgrG protein [Sandaracinus amylolyticus]